MKIRAVFDRLFALVFAPNVRKTVENSILILAGVGFLAHLSLIGLKNYGILELSGIAQELLSDPIAAIYTPFSLILIYEVYLLLFYLPRSFTYCVSKQFEIISLIVIRKIFKDIPMMDLSSGWMEEAHNIELMVDLIGFLLLFLLIYLFNKGKMKLPKKEVTDPRLLRFINSKRIVSVVLLVLLGGMSISTFYNWLMSSISNNIVENINSLFFNQFFTLLILADVVILLISFRFTEEYSKLIRNTGFIISTILIRLSFGATGILTIVLILTGVTFALLILQIYNATEAQLKRHSTS